MSSTTTNVGLYKKNPLTDGNDTFDINTMLNDNWDKIDAQLGSQVGVSPPPTAVNLVNGMQVVNVPQSSPLNNLNIKGRTLVNLLGRDGNCEDVSRFTVGGITLALDTTNKVYGNNSIKATLASTAGTMQRVFNTISGNKYLIVGELKNGNATNVKVEIASLVSGNAVTSTTAFGISYATFGAAGSTHTAQVLVTGASTKYAYADCLRVYEITSTEKTYIDNLSLANAQAYIAAKYPYVDDVKHVNAPYVIKYGENLLPTLNEWTPNVTANGSWVVNSPHTATLTTLAGAVSQAEQLYLTIPVIQNQDYYVSGSISAGGGFAVVGDVIPVTSGWGSSNRTFNSGNNTKISVYLGNTVSGAGTYTFTNIMLNLGTIAKPFKSRNDDILAFPNVQLASNVDGTVSDTLFNRDSKYFVEKRFRDVVLDGSLPWYYSSDFTGYKTVVVNTPPWSTGVADTGVMTKYDGKPITRVLYGAPASSGDAQAFNGAVMAMVVFDADSGWGETYIPTSDEVKAYFYGWRMHQNVGTGTPYSSGTKYWAKIGALDNTSNPKSGTVNGTDYNNVTLPTSQATGWTYTPYKLTYQLASPTFEEVTVDGSLSLREGLNQIEVGQGVVIREKTAPISDGTGLSVHINNIGSSAYTQLKNRTNRILSIFKNGKIDSFWTIRSHFANGYGGADAYLNESNFDPTATYEVSYIALEQHLLTASNTNVTFDVASNLKTVVDSLSQTQADHESRISSTEILARQIYNVPQKTTAPSTIYVDGTNGSNNNDGSAVKPFKTIQKAIDSIPQIVNHDVAIWVTAGTYSENVIIRGFSGKASIGLYGSVNGAVDARNYIVSSIQMYTSSCRLIVSGFKADATATYALYANTCSNVSLSYMSVTATTSSLAGLSAEASNVYLEASEISNRNIAVYGHVNANILVQGLSGSNNSVAFSASYNARIALGVNTVTATTMQVALAGGMISSTGVNNPWGDNTYSSRSRTSAYNSVTQNLSAGVSTKVLFQTEILDNLNEYDTSLSRFTVKNSGTYLVSGTIAFSSGMGTSVSCTLFLYANGTPYRTLSYNTGTNSTSPVIPFSHQGNFAAGSYLEIYVQTTSGTVLATSTTLEITQIA